MKLTLLYCILCIFFAAVTSVLSDCLASQSQTRYQSWNDKTFVYTLWNVDLFSVGTETITSLRLTIVPAAQDEKITRTWDLLPDEDGFFTLPQKGPSVLHANRLHFGYAVTGTTPAIITLLPTCANASTQPEKTVPPPLPRIITTTWTSDPSCSVSISGISSPSSLRPEGEQRNYREHRLSFNNTGTRFLSSVQLEVVLPTFASMEKFYGMDKTCCEEVSSVAYFSVSLHGLGPGATITGAGFLLAIATNAPPSSTTSTTSFGAPLYVVRGAECS